jgi:hypothetical protein
LRPLHCAWDPGKASVRVQRVSTKVGHVGSHRVWRMGGVRGGVQQALLVTQKANRGKAPKKQRKSSGSAASSAADDELLEAENLDPDAPKVFPPSKSELAGTLNALVASGEQRFETQMKFEREKWLEEKKHREEVNMIKKMELENERLRLELERSKSNL